MKENKKTVLLVEDDNFISEIYNTKLELEGFKVEVSMDGEEAVKKFKKINPDVVLLDVYLPKKDGWEVLEEIKQQEYFDKSKVLMLTNLGEKEQVEKARSFGVEDYFVKASYTPDEVVEKVKDILSEE
ncbi:MAG: response regulator [Candidatus Moraniibacteriota bacterium]